MLLNNWGFCSEMSTSNSSTPPATPAKRACDSCHRRKVKCIPVGEDAKPCKNCVSAGLECTFNNKVQKKGPKGSRAKVLSEIRETQKYISPRPPFSQGHSSRSESPSTFARTPGLLVPALIDHCLENYFSALYSILPMLLPHQTSQLVARMDDSIEDYCVVAALCAFVLLKPHSTLPPSYPDHERMTKHTIAKLLLDEALRVRKGFEWSEAPTLSTVYTSYYISICQHDLDIHDVAWIHLRQAMTVAHVLGLQDEDSYHYVGNDRVEISGRRRLFWTLYIVERYYALKNKRPLSLAATIQLPNPADEPEEARAISGFIHLINLYKPLDGSFFGLWNQSSPAATPAYISRLYQVISESLPPYVDCLEVQSIDVKISQQWLRALVWKLAWSNGLISSVRNGGFSYGYLLDVSSELVDRCAGFSQYFMEAHGSYMAEKIYDVTSILIDASASIQFAPEYDARECIGRLLAVIASLPNCQERLLPSLHAKISSTFSGTMVTPVNTNFPQGQLPAVGPPIHSPLPGHGHGFEMPTSLPLELFQTVTSHGQTHFQSGIYADLDGSGSSSSYPTFGNPIAAQVSGSGASGHSGYSTHLPPGTGYTG